MLTNPCKSVLVLRHAEMICKYSRNCAVTFKSKDSTVTSYLLNVTTML